jgi:hypothetical protein
MLVLSVDREARVLLAELSGHLTHLDFSNLERGALAFIAREGPVRQLIDLAGVQSVAIAVLLPNRASSRPITAANTPLRVYVAPTDLLFGLCRMFAMQQEEQGTPPSLIFRTRESAYEALGLVHPRFQPIETG